MDDQRHPLVHAQSCEQCVQVAAVLNEAIRSRAAVGQLLRVAHADQIGRKTASQFLEVGDDVAPEIGRRGVAMQEHNGVTGARLDIGRFAPQDVHTLLLIAKCCPHHDDIRPFVEQTFSRQLKRTKSMEKMIRSNKIFLQVSPHLPNHTIQKGFPAKLCLIFARIAPGIAVMEGVSVWPRERENFWTRPGYAVFGGHFMP
jgi:hypothetical protein